MKKRWLRSITSHDHPGLQGLGKRKGEASDKMDASPFCLCKSSGKAGVIWAAALHEALMGFFKPCFKVQP